jgi:membrane-associated phospholipid phosphatase
MIYLDEQLRFLHFLQEGRGPWIDAFFRFLNLFDTDYFACTLIAFVWIGCSWRWGSRFAFIMVVSGLVNAWMKDLFEWPRPFFIDPSLGLVSLRDYGFPSGGAQTAMLFGCLIIYFWKSRWAWPAGIFYVVLISFSRMFLGVHFPLDVLGGWVLGASLFYAFIRFDPPFERWIAAHPRIALGCTLLIPFSMALSSHDFKTIFLMVSVMPISVGIYLSTRFGLYFTAPEALGKKILLGLFGVISAFAVAFLIRTLPLDPLPSVMAQVTACGLWISLAASPFCKKVFRA